MRASQFFFASVLLAVGCGPSFQEVYESDVHFEHCYALDQSAVPSSQKRDCWKAWLHAYTYGQPRDRVDYASTRFAALSPNEARLSPNAAASAQRPATPTVDAPVPTNAFAPPPNMASTTAAVDAGAFSMKVNLPRIPGEDCAQSCAEHWLPCRTGCKDPDCAACDLAYRACMSACFADGNHATP